jgi:DNA-binding transcriptional LysR family regulator
LVLFDRIKGRLHPTIEAKRLFTEVNAVYQAVQRVNEVADDLIENRVGHLRIACSSHLGHSMIPQAIGRFYSRWPEVRIVLSTMVPSQVLHAVLTQQADLGVAFLTESHPNIQLRPLYENCIVAALPSGHPLAALDEITASDLVGQSFIGYGSDIPFGQLVRKLLREAGCELSAKVEVQQAHSACALVEAGVGIAFVDEITARDHGWSNILVRPVVPRLSAPISVLHGGLEPLSRVAHDFIAVLESMRSATRFRSRGT